MQTCLMNMTKELPLMLRTSLAILVLFAWSTTVYALPVTYVFSGVGSGTIDGANFSDSNFTLVTSGDTDDTELIVDPFDVAQHENLTGVLIVDGFPAATLTDVMRIFNAPDNEIVGIGGGEFLLDLLNLEDQQGVGLDTYDLTTSFGPITTSDPFFDQFVNIGSNQGDITFSDVSTLTYTATVIPEPNSLALLGLGGMTLLLRRRGRHCDAPTGLKKRIKS